MPNASPTADVPSDAELTKAAEFIREPVLLGDEDASVALAHGTARRRAIDQALAEQSEGLPAPSTAWRRRWSLLLGLERMLSVDEPTLADGTTTLGPHQVDALSGTLTALLTENQSSSAFVPAESPLDKPVKGEGPSGKEPRQGDAPKSRARGRRAGDAPDAEAAAPEAPTAPASDTTKAEAPASDATPDAAKRPANAAATRAAAIATPDVVIDHSAPADADALTALGLDPDDEFDQDYDDEGDEDASGEGSDVHGPSVADLAPTADELAELDALDLADDAEPFDESDDDQLDEQEEDPNAAKRFWFEHATGAGKTVAAMGFVDACRLGGVLILTHRRNLVEQFIDEIKTRGYKDRLSPPLLKGEDPVSERNSLGPVTVETYQWFVRHAGEISSAYTIVICDEAHTALGEKTSAAIRAWTGPIFIGMTATGALIARHVADLFPTQTSRFDLAQAARRGVIAPLRCVRIPPGVGVRTIAKVPLRRGEVDMEFDQEMLAEVLDQLPFNLAAADLYKTRFGGMAGVVYAAGVKHAYNLADAFNEFGIKAKAVSGETPKRELSRTLADYEAGKIDVLINAQLLAEGWNSPRATVCLHLAPTASKRIYQQRVGRVTRREPGKEAGLVVDFVHPGTKHDDPVVTLHSLLERDVYRGGAIVVGPVRRGRGRKVRVERRVLPVASDETIRIDIFKRELWRIAVEWLDYGEQVQWAALAGATVSSANWRKARAMLHFDRGGELRRAFLVTAIKRNPSQAVKLKAVQDIAALRDPEAFADTVDEVVAWSKNDRRDAVRVLLQSIADKPVGRRDQATAWIWQLAEATADEHEEYATQRWKDGKRLLGLLVNSAGPAHGRNARRLVQATREQDRRLQSAMLAAARPHTPESQQVITGARTRLARKPGALARELLRNIPKAGGQTGGGPSAKVKGAKNGNGGPKDAGVIVDDTIATTAVVTDIDTPEGTSAKGEPVEYEAYTYESEAAEHASDGRTGRKSRRSRGRNRRKKGGAGDGEAQAGQAKAKTGGAQNGQAKAKNGNAGQPKTDAPANGNDPQAQGADGAPTSSRRSRNRGRSRRRKNGAEDATGVASAVEGTSGDRGSTNGNGEPSTVSDAKASSNGSTTNGSNTVGSATNGDGANDAGRRRTRNGARTARAKAEPKPVDPDHAKSAIADAIAGLMGDAPKAKPAAAKSVASSESPVSAATADKPAPKPRAPRKTAAQRAAEAAAAGDAPKPRAPRKTAAQRAAEAAGDAPSAAATTSDKPAPNPRAPRKTATPKTAAAAKPATATKATAARKPAAARAKTAADAATSETTSAQAKAPAKPRAPRKPAAKKPVETPDASAS